MLCCWCHKAVRLFVAFHLKYVTYLRYTVSYDSLATVIPNAAQYVWQMSNRNPLCYCFQSRFSWLSFLFIQFTVHLHIKTNCPTLCRSPLCCQKAGTCEVTDSFRVFCGSRHEEVSRSPVSPVCC